jgi:cytochrome b561
MFYMQLTDKYHSITKSFHWLIVLMLTIEFAVGWLMPDIRRGVTPAGLVSFHMSFGICILLVMLARLLLRFILPVPTLEKSGPWWQNVAAKWTHYFLYALVIVLPITGWWLASSHDWTVTLFGLFTLPPLVTGTATESVADTIHVGTGILVLGLIGLHVLAALYHYYFLKDKTLQRMLLQ